MPIDPPNSIPQEPHDLQYFEDLFDLILFGGKVEPGVILVNPDNVSDDDDPQNLVHDHTA